MSKLYRVRCVYDVLGQSCVNVLHYHSPFTGSTAVDMANIFVLVVAPFIAQVQSTNVQWQGVTVTELLGGGVEKATVLLPSLEGDVSGESSQVFTSFGLRKIVETNVTRGGAMRVGGISENGITGNDVSQVILDLILELLIAIAQTLLGADGEYIPCVVRFDDPDYTYNYVTAADYVRLTTQNSRKVTTNATVSLATIGQGKIKSSTIEVSDKVDLNDPTLSIPTETAIENDSLPTSGTLPPNPS